ncbi:HIT family protein [Streptomyces sp. NBRC 109706]|uniref:HIT family protein n=1 Tax=Streptomyces sp. NBRC 109706 TaxID=1550035 RepID=UPI000782B6DC|nr:HIT domain-containing protein [Streptomyces sp. NBRC 109706]
MPDNAAPCPFCEIIAGRAPAAVVREWPDTIAILPRGGVHPGHVLVIPRRHVVDYADDPDVTGASARRAAQLGRALGVQSNLITSAGEDATQTVMHLHWHLIPRAAHDDITLPWPNRRGIRHTQETL